MRKALCLLWVIALSACAGGGPSTSTIPATQSAPDSAVRLQATTFSSVGPTTWIIGTGASTDSYAVQDVDFLPTAITINAGDSIAYKVGSLAGGDAHTVAFVPSGMPVPSPGDPHDLAPTNSTSTSSTVDGTKFVNSGILFGGQTYTIHFTKAGTFRILCLFHEPAMVMTVTVNRAGTPYPHTQSEYTHNGSVDEWADFSEARQSLASFPFVNGGNTFAAGIDPGLVHFPPADSTILRFLNSNSWDAVATAGSKSIRVGTVLTWVNETSNEPHTVTFNVAGQTEPPNIPPDPAINVASSGITTFDGSHIVNSGTLLGGQKFQLKFTKAGKFFYACLYHDNSRMEGTITVTP
jgi:plastocyanin